MDFLNSFIQPESVKNLPSQAKAYVPLMIQKVYGTFILITNQIYDDKPAPSRMVWSFSCAVVSVAVCLIASLCYKMLVSIAIILHSIMFYASIVGSLAGVGFCVSLAINFEKEINRITKEATREDSGTRDGDVQKESSKVDYTEDY